MTLPEQIKRLRELEAKATPGPWYHVGQPWIPEGGALYTADDPHGGELIADFDLEIEWVTEVGKSGQYFTNAEFVAETRNALPGILDALEQWQQLREADEKEIHRLRTGYLADENGNEYVAVCILKEKIREQQTQLAEAKEVLEVAAEHGCGLDETKMPFADDARALLEKWGKG